MPVVFVCLFVFLVVFFWGGCCLGSHILLLLLLYWWAHLFPNLSKSTQSTAVLKTLKPAANALYMIFNHNMQITTTLFTVHKYVYHSVKYRYEWKCWNFESAGEWIFYPREGGMGGGTKLLEKTWQSHITGKNPPPQPGTEPSPTNLGDTFACSECADCNQLSYWLPATDFLLCPASCTMRPQWWTCWKPSCTTETRARRLRMPSMTWWNTATASSASS